MRRLLLGLVTPIVVLTAPMPARADPRPVAHDGRWETQADILFRHLPAAELQYAHVLAQDTAGFMWIGADATLSRWDGYHVKSYVSDPADRNSVPDGQIATLYADAGSGLWVGTTIGGLSRYDPRSDGFVRYGAGPDGLQSPNVSTIAGDGHGGLWVGTAAGLDHVDPASGRVRHASSGADHTGAVNAVVQDDHGGLWLGTERGLLHRAAGADRFDDVPLGRRHGDPTPVGTLCLDHDGRLWIGTLRAGVLVLEPGRTEARRLRGDGRGGDDATQISAIVDAGAEGVWIGTAGGGVLVVEPDAGWRSRFVRHRVDTPSSLRDNDVMSLCVDRGGVVWVSTSLGLSLHNMRHAGVYTLLGATADDRPLTGMQVTAVLAHPDGRVWLGVGDSGGIDILDPRTGREAELRTDATRPRTALPAGKATTMVATGAGTVFIGTKQGLYTADAAGRQAARVDVPQRAADAAVYALCLVDDMLWVGGEDGLWAVSAMPSGGRPPLVRHLSGDSLDSRRITAIVPGAGRALWVGTATGLNRVDTVTGAVAAVHADASDPTGYAGGYVASLLLDRPGRLWVASIGVGLQVIDQPDAAASGRAVVRRIGVAQGLPHINVDALLADVAGQVWASTDNGVIVVDPRTFAVRTFGESRGVGIAQYWSGAAARTGAGDLLFGGVGGLTVVQPTAIGRVEQRPPVVVTETGVGGQLLPSSRFNVAASPELVIPPGSNDLTVEYAALDYAAPEQHRYSHRLLGFDRDWIPTGSGRRLAGYTNLPPGEYTLQLRGSGPDAPWTPTTHELKVSVRPDWYQTPWFRLAMALLAVLTVAAVVHRRTRSLERRQRELHALVALRTEELQESQRQLERIAYTDPLTGLANRRRFNEDVRGLVESALGGTRSVTLLLIDLDRFKEINDDLGHDAGDALLVDVARRLTAALRAGDRLARLGGDEFAVLMPDAEEADVARVCDRIIESVGRPCPHGGHTMRIGASIGAASCPRHARSTDALYKGADTALYAAKRGGRNTWRSGVAGQALPDVADAAI